MIIYQSKKIPQDIVSYGFFGRNGGVSEGVYDSLNCALGSDDQKDKVLENRARVAKEIGAKALHGVYQIHSCDAIYVDEDYDPDQREKGDALVTDIPGKALTILTADCTPVCFYGQKKNDKAPIIGIAHAGWKGALGGVLDQTIALMKDKDLDPQTLIAVIGPTIAQKSYEVGQEFYDQFMERDQESIDFFKSGKAAGKYHFDLPGYCAYRLRRLGVDLIDIADIDTYQSEEMCYSYRRSTHRQEADYARQISAVMIKE